MVADLFNDHAFDLARQESAEMAGVLRRMGEFEPARLSAEAIEYTTLPQTSKKLRHRFRPA